MHWFVDLTPNPFIPIKRRAVPSCARQVAQMFTADTSRSIFRSLPDSEGYRRWVEADTASEALCRAQDELQAERPA